MRRIVILILLTSLMYGLQFYEVQTQGDVEPKSLAAFGFVLLAAFIIGEFAAFVRLPRVTGYLLTGIGFGPYVANLFSVQVVSDLSLLNSLAVGLIAMTAGGELRVAELRQTIRAILTIIFFQVVVIVPLVLTTFIVGGSFLVDWGEFGLSGNLYFLLAMGAMFGVLAVGNSPAVSVALVNDTGAKGPFTSMNLGVTITKDLVIVVLFSIVTAISVSILSPGSGGFGETLGHLSSEMGLSLLAGVLIGLIVIAYLRITDAQCRTGEARHSPEVGEDFMLFIVGMIFLGMYVAEALVLEKILVFIIAGFLVENFSEGGHKLIAAIGRVSPPVYVVFFAMAGAGLNLGSIEQVLLFAILLAVARIFGMRFSTWLGARVAGLKPLFQSKLSLGFLSQAGVTLGLVIIAVSKLDQIDLGGVMLGTEVFSPIILGIVAINLMIGPIFLKMSLTASGETAEQRAAQASATHDFMPEPTSTPLPGFEEGDGDAEHPLTNPPREPRPAVPPPPDLDEATLGRDLAKHLGVAREALETAVEEFRWDFIEPRRSDGRGVVEQLKNQTTKILSELIGHLNGVSDVDSQKQWIRRSRVTLSGAYYEILRSVRSEEIDAFGDDTTFSVLGESIQSIPDQLPKIIGIDETEDLYESHETDNLYLKVRKGFSRARRRFGKERERLVPLRRLVEYYVAGPLPPNLAGIANMAGYQRFFFWRKVSVAVRWVDGQLCDALRKLNDPLIIEPAPVHVSSGDGDKEEIHPHAVATPEEEVELRRHAAQSRNLLKNLLEEANSEFSLVLDDLDSYAEELTTRLRSTVTSSYSELVKSCRIAGTYQLSNRHINTSKVYDQHRTGRTEISEALRRWRAASFGYSGRLLAVLDIIDLQHRAFGRVAEAKIDIADALLNDLRPVPFAVADRIKQGLVKVKKVFVDGVDMETAAKEIETLRSQLTEYIAGSAIARLERRRDKGRFIDLLEPFTVKLAADSRSMTHTYDVLEIPLSQLQEGVTPPEFNLRNLPLRELSTELLSCEVAVKLSAINAIITRTVDTTISVLSDIERVVSFNLDAALSELHSDAPTEDSPAPLELAQEYADGGLRRSLERLEEILQSIDTAEYQVGAMIQYETFQQLKRLQVYAVEGNLHQIKTYLAQRSLEETGHAAASGLRGYIQRAADTLDVGYKHIARPVIEQLTAKLKRRLGTEVIPDVPAVMHTEVASFAAVQNEAIPATYRRLFSRVPVEIEEFFIGRVGETRQLQSAFDRFNRGLPASVLVSGEHGCGKTSFIEHGLRSINSGLPVGRMAFNHNFKSERHLTAMLGDLFDEKSRDLDRLRQRLHNTKRKRIVVIEGLHNFYLRTLDGFDALQKFLLLLSETAKDFFWIVTIDSDSLKFVQNIVPLRDHVTHVIELQPLVPTEVRRLIDARHNVSGYKLRFSAPPQRTATFANLGLKEPRQEQLEADYYHALVARGHGNATLILYYWLKSLTDLIGSNTIEVAPLAPLETRFIADMSTEKLLALSTIVTHGGLTLGDFSKIFRVNEAKSRGLLVGLTQLNLLWVEQGRVDTYRLNPVLFKAVQHVLHGRNIL
ncbi:MAG: hypothetical protein AUK47_26500 [Deltaproteobacteria bacterium CG2_30_63_29]|nr:MAG: hypothetical protein AUK47_26500 [Deltaproteobacteria bacterium CG2_30_63_29]